VLLLVTSITVPAASAQIFQAIPAIAGGAAAVPEVAEVVIGGATFIVGGATIVAIGEHLGKIWDGVAENFNNFASGVVSTLNDLFAAPNWVDITSGEGQAAMEIMYEYYTATSGDGGKKDDKWYFEARKSHGKIEINTNRMDETQAAKEMGRGKNIMTLNKELAQNLVGKFRGLSEEATKALRFEGDHNPATGHFHHLHYEAKDMRLHCWSWK